MTAATGTWRLGHVPSLDGLRAIAIGLVLITHFDAGQFPGAGALGVTVFFTLSGFLITSLLLQEWADGGHIRLRDFYLRRALRLLPAYVVFLAGSVLLASAGWLLGLTPGMVLAAATYTSNWYLLAGTDGSGHIEWATLGNTWSLSIEEQFYLLWPVILIAVARWRGRRAVVWVAGIGALASLADATVTGRPALALDIAAWSLLTGCTLAAVMHQRKAREIPPGRAWSLLVLVVVGLGLSQISPAAAHFAGAVLAAGVIWAVVQRPSQGWLAHPVLVWVGRRSYGLYLWNSIVGRIVFRLDMPHEAIVAIGIPLSLVLAALSYRYVEMPFLRIKSRLRQPSETPREEELELAR